MERNCCQVNKFAKVKTVPHKFTGGKRRKIDKPPKTALPPRTEEELLNWTLQQRNIGIFITRDHVRAKAMEFAAQAAITNFKASDGWLARFFARHRLSIRAPTIQKMQNTTLEERNAKIQRFWREVASIREDFDIPPQFILNMDEVPVFDMVQGAKVSLT